MIKNTITYKNKIILTLYHQDFPNENLTLKRSKKEHIKKNWIIFTEEYVPDDEWEQTNGLCMGRKSLAHTKGKI